MKRLGWLPCVLTLAIGAGACNANVGDESDNATAQMGTGIDESMGTTGDNAVYQQEEQEPINEQAQSELPESASWIPVTGILGLLSVGGALGVRHLRRR